MLNVEFRVQGSGSGFRVWVLGHGFWAELYQV